MKGNNLSTMPIEFTKIHENGNDFILIDEMMNVIIPGYEGEVCSELLCSTVWYRWRRCSVYLTLQDCLCANALIPTKCLR